MQPAEIEQLKIQVNEKRNELKECPTCGGHVADSTVSINKSLIAALYEAYVHCGKNRTNRFERKDIAHRMSHSDYANFAHLTSFGGLMYRDVDPDSGEKIKAGHYGLNMARCRQFFHGERSIPVQIVKHGITGEILAATYVFVWQIPPLTAYLDANGLFDHETLITARPDWERQKNKPTVEQHRQAQLIL